MGLLSRRAPSPMAMPPCGGPRTSLSLGLLGEPLSRGSPKPPPPEGPTIFVRGVEPWCSLASLDALQDDNHSLSIVGLQVGVLT